jgi:hypothetical protein
MTDMGKGMRRSERRELSGTVRIAYSIADGSREEISGKVLDISAHGARVKVRSPVPPQSYVLLDGLNGKLRGNASVRYCQRHWSFYYLGLEFSGFRFALETLPAVQDASTASREDNFLQQRGPD